MVRSLNEYGIFLMQKGVNQDEFAKIRVVTFRREFSEYGVVRCSVCFVDFSEGDRLK